MTDTNKVMFELSKKAILKQAVVCNHRYLISKLDTLVRVWGVPVLHPWNNANVGKKFIFATRAISTTV